MKCWITREWECYIKDKEIPLEVCKLCIEVRLKLLMCLRSTLKAVLDYVKSMERTQEVDCEEVGLRNEEMPE